MTISVSIVIRTLNEQRYLTELLESLSHQKLPENSSLETVIIDSGSTDETLPIAKSFGCQITHIEKQDFSFGRSLNMGCEFARGEFLVFISGHCVPVDDRWLYQLISPLEAGCVYTYGKQIGRDTTKFSEEQLFAKYFPRESQIPQRGFFANNANSAIRREVWETNKFDEELTGCEDMDLARRLVEQGHAVGYVAEACVYHIHDESWSQVRLRFERESVAMQKIMPEVTLGMFDALFYLAVGILKDLKSGLLQGCLTKNAASILSFRSAQYWGVYRGNRRARYISRELKLRYFYPRVRDMSLEKD